MNSNTRGIARVISGAGLVICAASSYLLGASRRPHDAADRERLLNIALSGFQIGSTIALVGYLARQMELSDAAMAKRLASTTDLMTSEFGDLGDNIARRDETLTQTLARTESNVGVAIEAGRLLERGKAPNLTTLRE